MVFTEWCASNKGGAHLPFKFFLFITDRNETYNSIE